MRRAPISKIHVYRKGADAASAQSAKSSFLVLRSPLCSFVVKTDPTLGAADCFAAADHDVRLQVTPGSEVSELTFGSSRFELLRGVSHINHLRTVKLAVAVRALVNSRVAFCTEAKIPFPSVLMLEPTVGAHRVLLQLCFVLHCRFLCLVKPGLTLGAADCFAAADHDVGPQVKPGSEVSELERISSAICRPVDKSLRPYFLAIFAHRLHSTFSAFRTSETAKFVWPHVRPCARNASTSSSILFWFIFATFQS